MQALQSMAAIGNTPILVLMARKGGVGKSTLATLLARVYASSGLSVTLADLDPQGTSTQVLGQGPDGHGDPDALGACLLAGRPVKHLVRETGTDRLRVLPASERLTVFETQLAADPMGVAKIQRSLRSLASSDAELVIVDTPPTLGAFTFGALTAAQWAAIPTLCEHPSILTLPSALRTVAEAQTMNESLRVLAILANRLDRATRHGMSALQTLQQAFPADLARTVIPRAVAITDSMRPGCVLDPASSVMNAVTLLAEELLERMQGDAATDAVVAGNELVDCNAVDAAKGLGGQGDVR